MDSINDQRTSDRGAAPKIAQTPGRDGKGDTQQSKQLADNQVKVAEKTKEQLQNEQLITKEKEKQSKLSDAQLKLEDKYLEKNRKLSEYISKSQEQQRKTEAEINKLLNDRLPIIEAEIAAEKKANDLHAAFKLAEEKFWKETQEAQKKIAEAKEQNNTAEYDAQMQKLALLKQEYSEQEKLSKIQVQKAFQELNLHRENRIFVDKQLKGQEDIYKRQTDFQNKLSRQQTESATKREGAEAKIASILSDVRKIQNGINTDTQKFETTLRSISNSGAKDVETHMTKVKDVIQETSTTLVNVATTLEQSGVENQELVDQATALKDKYLQIQDLTTRLQADRALGIEVGEDELKQLTALNSEFKRLRSQIDTNTEAGYSLSEAFKNATTASESIANGMRKVEKVVEQTTKSGETQKKVTRAVVQISKEELSIQESIAAIQKEQQESLDAQKKAQDNLSVVENNRVAAQKMLADAQNQILQSDLRIQGIESKNNELQGRRKKLEDLMLESIGKGWKTAQKRLQVELDSYKVGGSALAQSNKLSDDYVKQNTLREAAVAKEQKLYGILQNQRKRYDEGTAALKSANDQIEFANKKTEKLQSIFSAVTSASKEFNLTLAGLEGASNEIGTLMPNLQETLDAIDSIGKSTVSTLSTAADFVTQLKVDGTGANKLLIDQTGKLTSEFSKYQDLVAKTQADLAAGVITQEQAIRIEKEQFAILQGITKTINQETEEGKKLYEMFTKSAEQTRSIFNTARDTVRPIQETAATLKETLKTQIEQRAQLTGIAEIDKKILASQQSIANQTKEEIAAARKLAEIQTTYNANLESAAAAKEKIIETERKERNEREKLFALEEQMSVFAKKEKELQMQLQTAMRSGNAIVAKQVQDKLKEYKIGGQEYEQQKQLKAAYDEQNKTIASIVGERTQLEALSEKELANAKQLLVEEEKLNKEKALIASRSQGVKNILDIVKKINTGAADSNTEFQKQINSITNIRDKWKGIDVEKYNKSIQSIQDIQKDTVSTLSNIAELTSGLGSDNEHLIAQTKDLSEAYVKYQNSIAETQKELAAGRMTDKEAIASIRKQQSEFNQLLESVDTTTEAGKKLVQAFNDGQQSANSIVTTIRRASIDAGDVTVQATRMKNMFGEGSAAFQTISAVAKETNATLDAVNTQMEALGPHQASLAAQVQKTADAYKLYQETAAKATADIAAGLYTAEEAEKAIQSARQAYEDMRDSIDQSTTAGEEFVKSFRQGEKSAIGIEKGMQKTVAQGELLNTTLSEAGKTGVGGIAEMGPVLQAIRKKDVGALRTAMVAMAAAVTATLVTVFAGARQEAKKLGFQYKSDLVDYKIKLLDLEAQRKQVGSRVSAEFANTMAQNAIAFRAASKTALFGKGIGSLNYGSAQLQQMGISAETIASTMTAIGNTTGKMTKETSRLASDMAVFGQRSGMSADEIAGLNEVIMLTSDKTAEAALNMQAGIQGLADKIGVSFGDLAKDISAASKDMLSYGIKNVEQLAKQVGYAKSLGVSFQEIANAGKSMVMNYQQSIKAEMELSALLGESVDLSEVRAKFAEGDQAGAMEALKATGLNPEDMDMFQQEALKSALGGMDISSIQKISEKQGKTAELGSTSVQAGNKEYIDKKMEAEKTMQIETAYLTITKAAKDAELDVQLSKIMHIEQQRLRGELNQEKNMVDFWKNFEMALIPAIAGIASAILATKMAGGIGGVMGMVGGGGGAGGSVLSTAGKISTGVVEGSTGLASTAAATGGAAGGVGMAASITAIANALAAMTPLGPAGFVILLFLAGLAAELLLVKPVIEVIIPLLIEIAHVFGNVLMKAFEEFAPVVMKVIEVIGTVLVEALRQAAGIIESIGKAIATYIGAIASAISTVIKAISESVVGGLKVVGSIIIEVLGAIDGVVTSIGNSIAAVVTAIGSSIEGVVKTMTESIKSLADINPLQLYALAGGITAVAASLALFGAGSGYGAVIGAIGGAVAKGINFLSGQDTKDPFEKLKEMAQYSAPINTLANSVNTLSTSMNALGTISVDTSKLHDVAVAIGEVSKALASFGGGAELEGALGGAFAKGVKLLSGQSTQDPFERLKEMSSYTDPILKLANAMDTLASSMARLSTMNLESLNKINWAGMTGFFAATQVSRGVSTIAEGVGNAVSSIGSGIKSVMSYIMPSTSSSGASSASTAAAAGGPVKTPQDVMIAELKGINKNTKQMAELTKAIEMLAEAQYLYDTSGTKINLAIDGRALGVALERKRKNLQGTNYSNFNTNG